MIKVEFKANYSYQKYKEDIVKTLLNYGIVDIKEVSGEMLGGNKDIIATSDITISIDYNEGIETIKIRGLERNVKEIEMYYAIIKDLDHITEVYKEKHL